MSKQVNIRLTGKQYEYIEKLAKRTGNSIGGQIKEMINGMIINGSHRKLEKVKDIQVPYKKPQKGGY